MPSRGSPELGLEMEHAGENTAPLMPDIASPQHHPPVTTAKEHLWSPWAFEFLWWLLSAAALGALISVLAVFDGKPPPSWPLDLTINTVVSVLATVTHSALIIPVSESISQLKWVWFRSKRHALSDFQSYDDASKGPWGSVLLLLNPRLWNVVSLGAIIGIGILFIGPTTQQLVSYPLQQVYGGQGIVPRAEYYYGLEMDNGGLGHNPFVESQMKGAIYNAMFLTSNTATPSAIAPTCETGNCTWAHYSTLAVCSDCYNLSASLTVNNNISCDIWTLENGFYINNMYTMNTSTTSSTIKFGNLINPILDLFSGTYPPGEGEECVVPTVHECALWFCVNTYKSKMTGGIFDETLVASWPGSTDQRTVPNSTISPPVNPQAVPLDYAATGSTVDSLQAPGTAENFSVDLLTLQIIRDWAGYLFLQSQFADPDSAFGISSNASADVNEQLYDVQVKYTNGLPIMMESIATKMTDLIRTKEGASAANTALQLTPAALGTATQLQLFVHVRWPWIIVSATLVGLGLVFLLLAVVSTARLKLDVLKSSSVAVLAFGLNDEARVALSKDGGSLKEVEQNAKTFSVALSKEDDHMALINVK